MIIRSWFFHIKSVKQNFKRKKGELRMDKQAKINERIEKGTVIGSWTVGDPVEKKGRLYYHCICECGKEKDVSAASLIQGKSKSCGCVKKYRANNPSGCPGVRWAEKNKRWMASLYRNGQNVYLGSFRNLDDAIKARKEAEKKYEEEGLYAVIRDRNVKPFGTSCFDDDDDDFIGYDESFDEDY